MISEALGTECILDVALRAGMWAVLRRYRKSTGDRKRIDIAEASGPFALGSPCLDVDLGRIFMASTA